MVPVLGPGVGLQPVLVPEVGQLLLVPGTGLRLVLGVVLQLVPVPVLGVGLQQLVLGTGLQPVLVLEVDQQLVLAVVVERMVGRTVLGRFLVPLVRMG